MGFETRSFVADLRSGVPSTNPPSTHKLTSLELLKVSGSTLPQVFSMKHRKVGDVMSFLGFSTTVPTTRGQVVQAGATPRSTPPSTRDVVVPSSVRPQGTTDEDRSPEFEVD